VGGPAIWITVSLAFVLIGATLVGGYLWFLGLSQREAPIDPV